MSVIDVRGLGLRRDGRDILRDVSFTITSNELVGLIGPNGGGKTTLLKTVLGVIRPDTGTVQILGREPGRLGDARSDIGYVPQNRAFDRDFPARAKDVVLMGSYAEAGLFRLPGRPHREKAYRALEAVGMRDRAERPIGRLSGGEQQRVFIAQALVSAPRLMILDEPTTGVDQEGEEALMDLLRRLRETQGLTVLMVSHNVPLIRNHTDRMLCLNRELYYSGPTRDITDKIIADAYHSHPRDHSHA